MQFTGFANMSLPDSCIPHRSRNADYVAVDVVWRRHVCHQCVIVAESPEQLAGLGKLSFGSTETRTTAKLKFEKKETTGSGSGRTESYASAKRRYTARAQ